jgi:F-type H+-transporting ATPase subunit c
MKKMQLLAVVLFGLFVIAAPVMAQPKDQKKADDKVVEKFAPPSNPWFSGAGIAAGLGMGLTIIGAGIGLGKIGSAALESMARQPEVAPRIQTAMIIIAAMLEGATLASVVLCYLIGGNSAF